MKYTFVNFIGIRKETMEKRINMSIKYRFIKYTRNTNTHFTVSQLEDLF